MCEKLLRSNSADNARLVCELITHIWMTSVSIIDQISSLTINACKFYTVEYQPGLCCLSCSLYVTRMKEKGTHVVTSDLNFWQLRVSTSGLDRNFKYTSFSVAYFFWPTQQGHFFCTCTMVTQEGGSPSKAMFQDTLKRCSTCKLFFFVLLLPAYCI